MQEPAKPHLTPSDVAQVLRILRATIDATERRLAHLPQRIIPPAIWREVLADVHAAQLLTRQVVGLSKARTTREKER